MASEPRLITDWPRWQLPKGTPGKCYPGQGREHRLVRPHIRAQIRACINGDKPMPIFFTGSVGTGKTCASLCLCDDYRSEYYAVRDWCRRLTDAMFDRLCTDVYPARLINESRCWKLIEQPDMLVVLDELGRRHTVSDHHNEAVLGVLDRRINLPLVVISNLNMGQIERLYDARIVSRLRAGTVVDFGTKDRRLERRGC
jgi:DNA replication protein DnaC